eukprot:gnl/TRDRNA2_/TRDRNA2_177001_c2_seq4.p1 gnl/TRDRNA2_/TRDRNA2_177001_c2~~gnl/TRDRNA2_/TRDRNA2_177001_c2_seq4.p1  ORF type:complete len:145 (-),score=27.08 gnl/TRDRNA2_/TRDRNA2_177001_c2_seq4:113-547(-)
MVMQASDAVPGDCAVGMTVDTTQLCQQFDAILGEVQARKQQMDTALQSISQKCYAQVDIDRAAFNAQAQKLQESNGLLALSMQEYAVAKGGIDGAEAKFAQAVKEYKTQISSCNTQIETYQKEICGTGQIGNGMYTIAERHVGQ